MPYKKIRPPRIAWETFARIVDTMPSSVETITFSLAGEPTLHDELGRMIDYAHRAGVCVIVGQPTDR